MEEARPISAFASLAWPGGAICGVSAVSAGVKNASPVPSAAWSTTNTHTGTCPASSAAASAAWAANRSRSAPSITGRRPIRSASTPPLIISRICGITPAANT